MAWPNTGNTDFITLFNCYFNIYDSVTNFSSSLNFLTDVKRPLMGKLQEGQGVIPLPANCMSQAIVDVSENMRAKIYSLYCKIGMNLYHWCYT